MDAVDLVSLRTAADWFPHTRGRKPNEASLARWIEAGRDGVLLQATQIGGQWFTSREWVEAFLEAADGRHGSTKP